jgi:diguanylate cyclase (GGDEF)-like protein
MAASPAPPLTRDDASSSPPSDSESETTRARPPRRGWKFRRPAEPEKGLGTALFLAGLFAALAFITRLICLDSNQCSVFWPANGAMVVAMLVLPWRLCGLVLALCFCANIAANHLTSYSPFDSYVYSALNILSSAAVALLTRRYCGAATDLSRVRRLAIFGTIAFLSSWLEAGLGELIHPFGRTLADAINDCLQWTVCDGLGFLLATPAILLPIKGTVGLYPCEASRLERWLLLIAAAVLAVVAFLPARSATFMLIYPLLILTAFRAGPPWVLASILITAVIAGGLSAHGYGPLTYLSSGKILLGHDIVQCFLISIFLATVPANNALGERSRAARRLLHMKAVVEHTATHDVLTRLVNRSLFRQRLGALLRHGTQSAVILVDLDRFKQVNDTMGHGAGDELLRSFAARLLGSASPLATVARFGGDEFAILLPCAETSAAEHLCQRIADAARMPFQLAGGTAHVSASVGVAFSSGRGMDAGELMRKADIALYATKAGGRDGYSVFSEDLDRSACERAEIEADLRVAIETGGQLELHYQSKVDSGHVVRGVEALLRWHHPSRGLISANQIIPVAEESGLIVPLGNWILREAVAFASRWPAMNVAINVSPVQLRHPDFVARTLQAVSDSCLPYGHLELEVTETSLIDDLTVVNSNLATLRASGIRIALDDFGTGYSSLRHLHRCAVDRVKIDRSFVGGLEGGNEAASIVRAVIELGHAMGLQVTAEGVETEPQRRFLLDLGIDEMQGFLFSKPASEAEFAAAAIPAAAHAAVPRYAVLQGGLAAAKI